MEVNSKQFYQPLIAMIVAVILIATIMMPIVTSLTQTTITTDIENDNAGWLKLGYAEGTDFDFEITNDGADVTVGEQTGSLGEMIYYADSDRVIFSKGTSMYMLTDGDNPTVYTFTNAVSVTNTAGTLTILDGSTEIATAESPSWAYFPDENGVYGFFTDGNLNLEEGKPEVAVGGYAGVFAYNDTVVTPDNIDLGLVMDGDYATGDVEWVVGLEENNDEPSQPLANQPTMVTMSRYSEIPVMGTANPSNGTQVGDLYYTFSGTNATVVGYSSSIDWSTFTSIPDTVTYNDAVYTINSIGDSAFMNCTSLALISLPSGVTTIGYNAFKNCTNLALTSLPSGLTSIGNYAFVNCTTLSLSSLPSSVNSIGEFAFAGCTNIAFTSLPQNLTQIRTGTFQKCTNLALTELPSGITRIESNAFEKCTNLALTELPSNLTYIGLSAFSNCPNISLTTLPNNITTIEYCAFLMCTNLALTELPSGITSIGEQAFSITHIELTSLPDGLTTIGKSAFSRCTDLAITSIPAEVTTIGIGAFYGCTNITSLIFEGSPTIGNTAFQDTGIKEILNLGETEITTTSYGLNADSVQDYVSAVGYVAPTVIHEEEVVTDDSVTSILLRLLPIMLVLSVLLFVGITLLNPNSDWIRKH